MVLRSFLIGILFPLSLTAQIPVEKHALLIGLSQFQDPGWSKLHGKEDMEMLAEVLKDKDFSDDHIRLCSDSDATKKGVINELENLENRVTAGSMVYIHFSSHGQQLEDDDTDPKEEADGMDECLVMYDSPKLEGLTGTYHGERHLSDDEIGMLLDKIRRKAGPNGQVLVSVDACHSGTATRSDNDPNLNRPLWFSEVHPVGNITETRNRLTGESGLDQTGMAPVVAIFAALPSEQTRNLTLSSAVGKAFANSGPYTTYAMFFNTVVSEIKLETTTITPNAEGLETHGDLFLFGGALADPIAYFLVKDVASDFQLTLDQGYFANLFPNTTLAFYPEGTRISALKSVAPLASGHILRSTEFTATVNIQKRTGVSDGDLQKSWAYVTNWVISDRVLAVQLEIRTLELKDALEKQLSLNKNFSIENTLQKGVRIRQEEGLISIYGQDGSLLYETSTPAASEYIRVSEQIERFLLQYQRFITIRDIRYKSDELAVTWNIYPVKCNIKCEPLPGKIDFDAATDMYPMYEGDCFGVEIKNNTADELFFTILDFRTRQFEPNVDMILIPVPEKSPESFSVKAGKSWKSSDFAQGYCWQIEPVYGKETLKLITSKLPVHLREAVKTRSITKKQEQMAGENEFDVQDIHILVKEKKQ